MRKVGFVIYPGYQTKCFATISAFDLANRLAAERVYDIRMLSKDAVSGARWGGSEDPS